MVNYLDRANLQLGKLQSLISDLLDISKIESGKIEYNEKPFAFHTMLQNAIEVISQTHDCVIIQKKSVEATVFGDENRIEQVVINFLTNAIKYSPDSKEIHVESSLTPKNQIMLKVKDFGIGVPKELQDKLFEKFYRVEGSANRFQGLGIGLYISSEIIKRHKGIVGVNSNPGKGSEFYFQIPIDNNEVK